MDGMWSTNEAGNCPYFPLLSPYNQSSFILLITYTDDPSYKIEQYRYSVYKLKHMLKPESSYTYAKPAASDQVDSGHNGVLEHYVTESENSLPSVAKTKIQKLVGLYQVKLQMLHLASNRLV